MRRIVFLSVVVFWTESGLAFPTGPINEAEAEFNAIKLLYLGSLEERMAAAPQVVQLHTETARAALMPFDGRALLAATVGAEYVIMKWSHANSRPEVFQENQLISFGNTVDATGRFSVSFGDYSATVDVLGDILRITVSGPGGANDWTGVLDQTTDPSLTVIGPQSQQLCMCRGTSKRCPGGMSDCQGQQPCNTEDPDNPNSQCVVAAAPPSPPPDDGCGQATEVVPVFVIPPGLLIGMHFRRRVRGRR